MEAKDTPTFIKAAIMDWKHGLITSGRLFEILRVPFGCAYRALLDEEDKTGKWFDIPAKRIEEIIMTNEFLEMKAHQDLELRFKAGIKEMAEWEKGDAIIIEDELQEELKDGGLKNVCRYFPYR